MPDPKNTEEWPEVRLMRAPKTTRLRIAPSTPPPGYERSAKFLSETYLPVSKVRERLLSDEVVIAVTKRRHPMLAQYEPKRQQMVLVNARQDLETALDASLGLTPPEAGRGGSDG